MLHWYQHLDRLTRRRFLNVSMEAFAAVAGLTVATAGLMRLPLPKVLPMPSRRFRIGKLQDFPPGTERYFERERVLVRADERGVYAVSLVCTHLGCTVAKKTDSDGFLCPCHGSRYRNDGSVIAGPAPRRLRTFQVVAEPSGWIAVDAAREVAPDTRLEA